MPTLNHWQVLSEAVDEFHGLAFVCEVQRDGEAVFGGHGFSLAAAGGRLNTDFHR